MLWILGGIVVFLLCCIPFARSVNEVNAEINKTLPDLHHWLRNDPPKG